MEMDWNFISIIWGILKIISLGRFVLGKLDLDFLEWGLGIDRLIFRYINRDI